MRKWRVRRVYEGMRVNECGEGEEREVRRWVKRGSVCGEGGKDREVRRGRWVKRGEGT